MTGDGLHFVALVENSEAPEREIQVVVNVLEELERRLDGIERESADFRAEWRTTHAHVERRLDALEN